MDCSMPDFPSLHYLPESAQIHAHWVNDAIQPSHPLSSPSVFHSIRVLSNEPALCIRWTKYWSFGFGISLSDEYTGLISFRIDWCDPLAVQGTLKSFHQHYHSKASVLWWSAFFMVQLSHPYTTAGKTIALTVYCGRPKIIAFSLIEVSRSSLQSAVYKQLIFQMLSSNPNNFLIIYRMRTFLDIYFFLSY